MEEGPYNEGRIETLDPELSLQTPPRSADRQPPRQNIPHYPHDSSPPVQQGTEREHAFLMESY